MTPAINSSFKWIADAYRNDPRREIEKLAAFALLATNTICLTYNWYTGKDSRLTKEAMTFSVLNCIPTFFGNATAMVWLQRVVLTLTAIRTFDSAKYTYAQHTNQLDTDGNVFEDPRGDDIPYSCLELEEGEENPMKTFLAGHLRKDRYAFNKTNGLVDPNLVVTEEMLRTVLSIGEKHSGFRKEFKEVLLPGGKLVSNFYDDIDYNEIASLKKLQHCLRHGKKLNP